jgi:hypothetical protein
MSRRAQLPSTTRGPGRALPAPAGAYPRTMPSRNTEHRAQPHAASAEEAAETQKRRPKHRPRRAKHQAQRPSKQREEAKTKKERRRKREEEEKGGQEKSPGAGKDPDSGEQQESQEPGEHPTAKAPAETEETRPESKARERPPGAKAPSPGGQTAPAGLHHQAGRTAHPCSQPNRPRPAQPEGNTPGGGGLRTAMRGAPLQNGRGQRAGHTHPSHPPRLFPGLCQKRKTAAHRGPEATPARRILSPGAEAEKAPGGHPGTLVQIHWCPATRVPRSRRAQPLLSPSLVTQDLIQIQDGTNPGAPYPQHGTTTNQRGDHGDHQRPPRGGGGGGGCCPERPWPN